MKKWFLLCLLLLCAFSFTACDDKNQSEQTSTQQQQTTGSNPALTEQDIIALFQSQDDSIDTVVTDCILISDKAFHLVGVVQYTDSYQNPCNLAFIKADGFYQTINLDGENLCEIAQESKLSYMGDGAVALTLQQKGTDQLYDYTVTYEKDGPHTKFTANSVPRKLQ